MQRAASAYDRLAEAPEWLIPADMRSDLSDARKALDGVTASKADDVLRSQADLVMELSEHLYLGAEQLTKDLDLVQVDSYSPTRDTLGEWLPPRGPRTLDGQLVSIVATSAADFAEVMADLPVRNRVAAPAPAPAPEPEPAPPEPVTINQSAGFTSACQNLGDVLLVQQFAAGQSVDITATGPWAASVTPDGTVTVHACND
ncbi:hypothetical protein [Leucobacter sp. cx-169]|uniref:hypothetical protein n=1 Tax=Leucobacter sp. cx-169 TaxID=2770549 RepID=UPI00165E098E|nr:hypothetical protein [Leucobacter sp. cx-169]MBC9927318.1 hypothetical protein [Leucobacter sp. cx-169]